MIYVLTILMTMTLATGDVNIKLEAVYLDSKSCSEAMHSFEEKPGMDLHVLTCTQKKQGDYL